MSFCQGTLAKIIVWRTHGTFWKSEAIDTYETKMVFLLSVAPGLTGYWAVLICLWSPVHQYRQEHIALFTAVHWQAAKEDKKIFFLLSSDAPPVLTDVRCKAVPLVGNSLLSFGSMGHIKINPLFLSLKLLNRFLLLKG